MESPVISFTFDDFPRSALLNAGAILRERGLAGTYYASFGLIGKKAPTGEIFTREDLDELIRQKHELACHTFDHYDSWDTAPDEFEASILRNQRAISERLPGTGFRSLSYPISWPRPETKRRAATYYECARGGGQTFNSGTMDLNYLKAFFIEQSRDNFEAIRQTIKVRARRAGRAVTERRRIRCSILTFYYKIISLSAGYILCIQPEQLRYYLLRFAKG